MNGQPCVRNLRLPVRRVLEALALHSDRAELFREYPASIPSSSQTIVGKCSRTPRPRSRTRCSSCQRAREAVARSRRRAASRGVAITFPFDVRIRLLPLARPQRIRHDDLNGSRKQESVAPPRAARAIVRDSPAKASTMVRALCLVSAVGCARETPRRLPYETPGTAHEHVSSPPSAAPEQALTPQECRPPVDACRMGSPAAEPRCGFEGRVIRLAVNMRTRASCRPKERR